MAQGAERQIQVAEVLGSMLTGVIFYCLKFCFHEVKHMMAIQYCHFCQFWPICERLYEMSQNRFNSQLSH